MDARSPICDAPCKNTIQQGATIPPIYLLFSSPALQRLLRMTLLFEGRPVRAHLAAREMLAWLRFPEATPSLVLFGDYLPGMSVEIWLRHLLQEPSMTQRHAFLLLSTQANALPSSLTALIQTLSISVLPLPFVPEQLFATLAMMEQHLP